MMSGKLSPNVLLLRFMSLLILLYPTKGNITSISGTQLQRG